MKKMINIKQVHQDFEMILTCVFLQVLIWLHVVQVVKGSLTIQAAQDKGEPGKHN